MKFKNHAIAVMFTALLLTTANAGEPCRKFLGCPVPDCIGKWCCDDYRAKCLPCVKVPLCFGCDDYCRKTMPRVCTPLCFTCDDYCKKCQPPVCRPPLLNVLRCVPEPGACGCTPCRTGGCDQANATPVTVTLPQLAQSGSDSRGTAVVEQASDFETEEADQQYSRSPVIIEVFKR